MKELKHLNLENMRAFVSGKLDEAENEAIITHLGECDTCLGKMDQLWTTQPNGNIIRFPSMMDEQVQKLEENFLRRMQRANLGNRVIHFGTTGFLQVVLALLAPWFATRHKNEWRKT